MKSFVVLYRDRTLHVSQIPYAFQCSADDADHAEEQLLNAEPDADVVWVVETESVEKALDDYYDSEMD